MTAYYDIEWKRYLISLLKSNYIKETDKTLLTDKNHEKWAITVPLKVRLSIWGENCERLIFIKRNAFNPKCHLSPFSSYMSPILWSVSRSYRIYSRWFTTLYYILGYKKKAWSNFYDRQMKKWRLVHDFLVIKNWCEMIIEQKHSYQVFWSTK